MGKFKVGDRVRFIQDTERNSFQNVTIIETDRLGPYPIIGDDPISGKGSFSEEHLEFIDERINCPIRTVTRKEIVPGVYGCIHVGGVDASSRSRALVTMHSFAPTIPLKAFELRDAARILVELADALDDGA